MPFCGFCGQFSIGGKMKNDMQENQPLTIWAFVAFVVNSL
jgi:hypothetical protein